MALDGWISAAVAIAVWAPARVAVQPDPGFELHSAGTTGLGSGCDVAAGDVKVIAMGSDVSIVYSKLAARLPASASDTALSVLESCAVRVPATLHAGSYVPEVKSTLRFGVDKSAGSTGRIAVTIGFAEFPNATFTVDVPGGARMDPSVFTVRNTPFLGAGACSGSDVSGLFRADVAITGKRPNAGEKLVIGAVGAGHDVRYDLTFSTAACSP